MCNDQMPNKARLKLRARRIYIHNARSTSLGWHLTRISMTQPSRSIRRAANERRVGGRDGTAERVMRFTSVKVVMARIPSGRQFICMYIESVMKV